MRRRNVSREMKEAAAKLGKRGGAARARNLTPAERRASAVKAAKASAAARRKGGIPLKSRQPTLLSDALRDEFRGLDPETGKTAAETILDAVKKHITKMPPTLAKKLTRELPRLERMVEGIKREQGR